jgi:hypothetical protein
LETTNGARSPWRPFSEISKSTFVIFTKKISIEIQIMLNSAHSAKSQFKIHCISGYYTKRQKIKI